MFDRSHMHDRLARLTRESGRYRDKAAAAERALEERGVALIAADDKWKRYGKLNDELEVKLRYFENYSDEVFTLSLSPNTHMRTCSLFRWINLTLREQTVGVNIA